MKRLGYGKVRRYIRPTLFLNTRRRGELSDDFVFLEIDRTVRFPCKVVLEANFPDDYLDQAVWDCIDSVIGGITHL